MSANDVNVSHMTISRYLKEHGYQKSIPQATPMLTTKHKEKRVEWATNHLNDDWSKTLFSDETAFQLFRNTVSCWHREKDQSDAFQKIEPKFWLGVGFVSKEKPLYIAFLK